jgi:solute carrier family 25 phosphate transporter 3
MRSAQGTHHDQGLTHAVVTPLDLVKTRRQVDSKLYKSNFQAWGHIYRGEGLRGIFTGWSPTLFGYSAQGAFKYGFYEFFKKTYSDMAGPENAYKYKTALYLSASASAEFLADIALCPFEAIKVRMQGTIPAAYTGTLNGFSKITAAEGVSGLYKGLYPLWGRQIPYTMMKFASFETIVEMIYDRLPGSKSDYSKAAQTGVSFTGGYLAGILCAIVSHPADVMVSKLNTYRKAGEGFGTVTSRIYKDIGFRGLWNGLPVRIVMIGTLTGLQWMIYVSVEVDGEVEGSRDTDWFAGLLQDLYGPAHDGWRAAAAADAKGVRAAVDLRRGCASGGLLVGVWSQASLFEVLRCPCIRAVLVSPMEPENRLARPCCDLITRFALRFSLVFHVFHPKGLVLRNSPRLDARPVGLAVVGWRWLSPQCILHVN